MSQPFWHTSPNAPFATLIWTAHTYCHPETDEEAYDTLKRRAKREDIDEMAVFKMNCAKPFCILTMYRATT
jgi:hypothetical protein